MDYFGAKQPFEEYYVNFDFMNYLDGDGIASALVTATDAESGEDVTTVVTDSTKQSTSGPKVFAAVRAGDVGHSYKLTCRITTDNGSKYELDGILPVTEA